MANTFKSFKGTLLANTWEPVVPAAGASNTAGDPRSAASVAVSHSVYVSNVDGVTQIFVDIRLYDTGTTQGYYLGYQLPVPVGATLVFDKPVTLAADERLEFRTASASDAQVVCAVLEQT